MDARWGAIDCRPEDGVYFACRLLQKFYVIDMRYAIMSDVHANPLLMGNHDSVCLGLVSPWGTDPEGLLRS